jgi:hypothetical protein
MKWVSKTHNISNVIILPYAKKLVEHYRHFFSIFLTFSSNTT